MIRLALLAVASATVWRLVMAKSIFISFAIEDKHLRDFLIGQKNNEKSDIEFKDMSVKQAWDSAWKTSSFRGFYSPPKR